MSKFSNEQLVIPDDLKRNWGWLMFLGAIFVLLGCVGLSMTMGLTLMSMLFFGALLIIAGVIQVVDVFKSCQWKPAFWHALVAVLYVTGGGLVIYDPFLVSTVITALLAGVLIVIGCSRLIMAFSLKEAPGWGWLVLAGFVAILLGSMILMQWPQSGFWIIGLFIAIQMIVDGWSYLFIALASRKKS